MRVRPCSALRMAGSSPPHYNLPAFAWTTGGATMPENNYIAVDLGAESGRVMLGTLTDAGINVSEIHRFANLQLYVPTKNPNGSLHWDILRLWHEIKSGLAKAASAC